MTKIRYTITDGGELDEDGLENGIIVDPSGPAAIISSVKAPTFDKSIGAPNTGFNSIIRSPLVLVAEYTLAGISLICFGYVCRRFIK